MNLKQVSSEATCCQCGMEKSHWSAPQGVNRKGDLFCCERCADETGCRCEEILRQSRPLGKATPRRGFPQARLGNRPATAPPVREAANV